MTASRVLIIEGDGAASQLAAKWLSEADYVVSHAADAKEAWAVLSASGEHDVVLADLSTIEPGAKGGSAALLQQIKSSFPDTPVIVCAAEATGAAMDSVRHGAYDDLAKPLQRDPLLLTVARAVEYRRLKQENRAYQSKMEFVAVARSEQLVQAMTDLERSYELTIEIAADLQGLKDSSSIIHARYVTAFTIALARAMRLDGEKIRSVARAAILHDIGMIAVPDAIIHKPGPLNPEETRILREHCFRGYQILKKIPYLAEPAELVYAHEERYDGTGFPRGLKGEAIPLGARIFSVAHAFDAIVTDRPYRRAKSLLEARVEIAQLAGKQFDPEVVRVFLDMPDKIWADLRSEIDRQSQYVT